MPFSIRGNPTQPQRSKASRVSTTPTPKTTIAYQLVEFANETTAEVTNRRVKCGVDMRRLGSLTANSRSMTSSAKFTPANLGIQFSAKS
jgi:hypothetical protein